MSRDHRELAEALRLRADALCGEAWERAATVAMLREAADALEGVSTKGILVSDNCKGCGNPKHRGKCSKKW